MSWLTNTALPVSDRSQSFVILVKHKKKGREHAHAVFQRTDTEKGILISDSHNYPKHEQASRRIEKKFDLRVIPGVFTERAKDAPRPGYDKATKTYNPQSYSYTERVQAQKSGIDPKELKTRITKLWERSDTGKAFVAGLETEGYRLARGTSKRTPHVLVDEHGHTFSLVKQIHGMKKAQVVKKLSAYPVEKLADVEEVKKHRQERQEQEAQREAAATAAQIKENMEQLRQPQTPRETETASAFQEANTPRNDNADEEAGKVAANIGKMRQVTRPRKSQGKRSGPRPGYG